MLTVARADAGNTYIMVPPQNTTALEGSRVKLGCQAEAFPNNVTYEWWRHSEDNDKDVVLVSSSRTTIYADGSLVFASVDVADAGWYICRPTNGLGLTPEAKAYLNVTCKYRSQAHREGEGEKSFPGPRNVWGSHAPLLPSFSPAI